MINPVIIHSSDLKSVCDFELTIPEKINGRYISFISIHGNPLYVQTPFVKFISQDTEHLTISADNDSINQLISELTEICVKIICQRSPEFFKGKCFNEDKIKSSFVSIINDDDKTLKFIKGNNFIAHDQFDYAVNDVHKDDNMIALIKVDNVTFTSGTMQLSLKIEQMKYYQEYKLDWCVNVKDKPDIDIDIKKIIDKEIEKQFSDDDVRLMFTA